jgi:hypothetical protein
LRVTSATQSLDAVQQAVSSVLGMPFNKVAVGAHPAAARQSSRSHVITCWGTVLVLCGCILPRSSLGRQHHPRNQLTANQYALLT